MSVEREKEKFEICLQIEFCSDVVIKHHEICTASETMPKTDFDIRKTLLLHEFLSYEQSISRHEVWVKIC